MKRFLLLSTCFFLVSRIWCAVYTVSNNPDEVAQYNALQTAIDDAFEGDTLLISGSETSYGDITINKPIIIIGQGHNPQILNGKPSKVGTVTISGVPAFGRLESLSIYRVTTTGTANFFVISNCRLTYTGNSINLDNNDNWQIVGNVIDGYIDLNTTADTCLISNNILNYHYIALYDLNATSMVFNNVFICRYSTSFFNNCNGALIANNIFVSTNSSSITPNPNTGCAGCTYVKNMTYQTYGFPFATIPNATNYGYNNYNNINPRFETYSTTDQYFSYSHNYQLKDISQGKNAGTDGTDLGVFGSNYNFSNFGYGQLPRIDKMQIVNAVLPLDSAININIEAVSGK